jgi:hypothetical protein
MARPGQQEKQRCEDYLRQKGLALWGKDMQRQKK